MFSQYTVLYNPIPQEIKGDYIMRNVHANVFGKLEIYLYANMFLRHLGNRSRQNSYLRTMFLYFGTFILASEVLTNNKVISIFFWHAHRLFSGTVGNINSSKALARFARSLIIMMNVPDSAFLKFDDSITALLPCNLEGTYSSHHCPQINASKIVLGPKVLHFSSLRR